LKKIYSHLPHWMLYGLDLRGLKMDFLESKNRNENEYFKKQDREKYPEAT
jgi:hypothetical protein